jgi:hypothetical protein
MLGEFFAVPKDEIESFVEGGPYGRVPIVEAKRLTEVSLATLGEIMGAGSYDELVDQIAQGAEAQSGEAGVLSIVPKLRDALAATEDLRTVADRWAATEELSADGWETEDALEVLSELGGLARDARAAGVELWYWWSL